MIPLPSRSSEPNAAEAGAWADVLVRRRLLHTAVFTPNRQWLVQDRPDGPVRVLLGPADVVALAATIQHRTRTMRPETR
ncbi:hypothetical protein [Streptomyces sp. GQFP]|uniref:hypothetical protein n=1 Tax=Streptomyces sp. GQFP TaxID=2907545 RepID=UPI001F3A5806|nr:hypothetical protein [Streptomyces sp. GQFP]UIX34437.1 hypothetical protein LUX31_33005 [Streptomyces sp. GQFP]